MQTLRAEPKPAEEAATKPADILNEGVAQVEEDAESKAEEKSTEEVSSSSEAANDDIADGDTGTSSQKDDAS